MKESIEKQKDAWIDSSLIRNLSTLTFNFVLYFNGIILNGISDINYQPWNYAKKNPMKIINKQ